MHDWSVKMTRRSALALSGTLPAAVLLSNSGVSQADAACNEVDAMADAVSKKLFSGDGLARPVPDVPTPSDLARGLDRTLVLGGGGEYYVAWYCGFFHGLMERGIDPAAQAQMVVGTSAGAYAGSSLTSGHFRHLHSSFEFFGKFPGCSRRWPRSAANASQQRAREINAKVTSGDPASIKAIGHAALAADNSVNGDSVERLAWLLTGDSRTDWPPSKMYTTANDCYTGERLVVGQKVARRNGISLARAGGPARRCPAPSDPPWSASGTAWTAASPRPGRTPTSSRVRSGRWSSR